MRKIREVLRLHFECGLKFREIGRSCRLSAGKVSQIVQAAANARLAWPLPKDLSDSELDGLLHPERTPLTIKPLPDFDYLSKELKRKGVTRHLLWEEYRRDDPDGYGYTQFCEHFKRYVGKLDPELRREHKAGEKLFVDWAGQTIGYRENGELKQAQLFVAVLGASNYTFADVYRDQRMPNWISAHVEMLAFIGGVPEILVPDNTKTGVSKPCYYDPELNPTYQDLATHYNTVVIPARAYHPKDKAAVESGVRFAETQILAALRNCTFQSFGELKEAVREKLKELNERPFNKLKGNRCEAFAELDEPVLKPLPASAFELGVWQQAKVWNDYHIQVDKHYYSVHHDYLGERVEVRLTSKTVEIYHDGKRIAAHQRSHEPGKCTTLAAHRPEKHNALIQCSTENYLRQGQLIGPNTLAYFRKTLDYFPHPEMGFRSCQGILRLRRDYGAERLEAACAKALEQGLGGFRIINNILKNKRENQSTANVPIVQHGNVRGAKYYQ